MRTLLSGFNRLKSIQYPEDERTPSSWFSVQPCARIHFAGREWIVTQPMSTFWVYALGVLTIGAGLYFLQIRAGEASRLWWGVSLLIWGIGALLAGTRYQAFGYEVGKPYRTKEVGEGYVSAMLAAIAYSCSTGPLREILLIYAVVNSTVYVAAIFISGIIPYKPLITFEFMVFASCPIFLMMIGVNGWRYLSLRESMDLALLGTWALLGVSMLAYWVYDKAKVTETLWAKGKGRWFSQNDVLHVFLIVWIIYIAVVVSGQIHDM